ncbi:hypothetical protein MNB_SV-15-1127 [hydrothermal vent metagenome]|uniref:Uncharacterized protein n=1 Tax=hydrothermal vent metagenome TaxID=652676 RepID=A0A1W1EKZ4_9ZZZZ
MAQKGPPYPEPTTPPPAGYEYKKLVFPEGYKIKAPKIKKKKRLPILEIVAGVGLFIFIVMSTKAKIAKEKRENSQTQYIGIDSSLPPKRVIKEKKESNRVIEISNFSQPEQEYINRRCKNKNDILSKNKCIRKSINELLDLY